MNDNTNQTGAQGRLVLVIVTALAGLWTAGVVLAPWLTAQDSILGSWLRLVYRPGCHQITDRCIDLGFGPLAVCARCAGLYLGGLLGLLWTTARNRASRPRPIWLVVVAVPTVIDFAAGEVGLPSTGNWLRFSLALPVGLFAGLYLGDALFEIVCRNTPQNAEYRRQDSVG